MEAWRLGEHSNEKHMSDIQQLHRAQIEVYLWCVLLDVILII